METNEVKKVVYLKDLTKVAGTVSDYEYRIDDDTDVEIRIEEGDIPSDNPPVYCLSIINTVRSNASVTVHCEKRTAIDVHSTCSLRIVKVCRNDAIVLSKSVSTLILGKSIYNTICRELVLKLNNGRKDIKIEDSVIRHVSSADKIIIYGSVIHNANILNMVAYQSNIKYIANEESNPVSLNAVE